MDIVHVSLSFLEFNSKIELGSLYFKHVVRLIEKSYSFLLLRSVGHDMPGSVSFERTSDGGNGNYSVLLPIILIKIKVDQMLPSSL